MKVLNLGNPPSPRLRWTRRGTRKRLLFLALFGAMSVGSAGAMEHGRPKLLDVPDEVMVYELIPFLPQADAFRLLRVNRACRDYVAKGCKKLGFLEQDLAGFLFKDFVNLEEVAIECCRNFDFSGPKNKERIKKLVFVGQDLEGFSFKDFVNLEEVEIRNCSNVDLSGLKNKERIKKLDFCDLGLAGFSFKDFVNLEKVTIWNCSNVDLSGLKDKKGIKELFFQEQDLQGFSFKNLVNLKEVTIWDCKNVSDSEIEALESREVNVTFL